MCNSRWDTKPDSAIAVLACWALFGTSLVAGENPYFPSEYRRLFSLAPEPQLSEDGDTLHGGVRPLVVVADPNPPAQSPSPSAYALDSDLYFLLSLGEDPLGVGQADGAAAALPPATFSIQYLTAGQSDKFGQTCSIFPDSAKSAFNAAAAIWSNILRSAVPITVKACWADLGSSIFLGYSGGGSLHRNFSGAPLTNTWYSAALANSLAGSDLSSGNEDMHLTFNLGFSWYYGTDGNTPANLYDLVSIVLHEIAHGLNFSGSMNYASGFGYWGFGTSSPDIYDTFMKNGAGIDLTSYSSGSMTLGSQLISEDVWFHGPHAMSANGGEPVKIYAPSMWEEASSYSHLDYDTFNDTDNQLMVYAISSGESIQDPGPVTKGLLQDLGWTLGVGSAPDFAVTAISLNPTLPRPSSVVSATPREKDQRGTPDIDHGSAALSDAPLVDTGSFSARVTLTNLGTAAGDAGYLAVWTDQPTSSSCGGIGAQRIPVGRLAAGTSVNLYFKGLQGGSAGMKTFRAFVDNDCHTAESNEGNNQLTLNYSVGPPLPKPDFVITDISLSPSAPLGQSAFSATVTIQNQGATSGDAGWLRVWSHEPTPQGCGAVSSRAMWLDSLALGESRSFVFPGLPAGAQGAKTFRAFVDSDCETTESNEGNNQFTKDYSVGAAPPSPSS